VRQDNAAGPLGDASPFRFAVIVSRFNEDITTSLRDAAVAALKEAGAAEGHVQQFSVPGAFEIPQAARAAAESGRFDAIVCLGCIIRGETPHFDYIAQAAAQGILQAAQRTGVPIAFGVLTTNTADEAMARAGDGPQNKGVEAARAAVAMARLYARLGPVRTGHASPAGRP